MAQTAAAKAAKAAKDAKAKEQRKARYAKNKEKAALEKAAKADAGVEVLGEVAVEAVVEQLVERQEASRRAVRFLSPCPNYQILVKPYIISIVNGFPVHDRGESIEFDNGEYLTDNEATLAFLRKHQAYGSEFFEDATPPGADDVCVKN